MSDQHDSQGRVFGSVADAYDRGRPAYPVDAAAWLTGAQPLSVLELGAGTGKLTAALVGLGHDVHATDPDRGMLDVLSRDLPDVRTSLAAAEEIPAGDRSFDVVVAAQSFHWFHHDRALAEIARVLKPGGRLSLVWNQRDVRIPWVRRLGALFGDQEARGDLAEPLEASRLFGDVEETTFRSWQTLTRSTIQDLTLSRSDVASLEEAERTRMLEQAAAFYDAFGRGIDGIRLPYVVRCHRATVVDRPEGEGLSGLGAQRDAARAGGDGRDIEPPTDGDSGLLLIDFR